MAGVKGRSGGPRKNSGGKRPGAGRKPKNPQKPAARKIAPEPTRSEEVALGASLPSTPAAKAAEERVVAAERTKRRDAKAFLEGVLSGEIEATDTQIRAAQALLPFQHKKLGETGKKEQAKEDAGKVAGRFTPAPPPRLAAVHGKRV